MDVLFSIKTEGLIRWQIFPGNLTPFINNTQLVQVKVKRLLRNVAYGTTYVLTWHVLKGFNDLTDCKVIKLKHNFHQLSTWSHIKTKKCPSNHIYDRKINDEMAPGRDLQYATWRYHLQKNNSETFSYLCLSPLEWREYRVWFKRFEEGNMSDWLQVQKVMSFNLVQIRHKPFSICTSL